MKLPQDFKEFLELFNSKNIEYMIVGSYALAYYGAPRYTGDIDVFVHRTQKNAALIIEVLRDFGFSFQFRGQTPKTKKLLTKSVTRLIRCVIDAFRSWLYIRIIRRSRRRSLRTLRPLFLKRIIGRSSRCAVIALSLLLLLKRIVRRRK